MERRFMLSILEYLIDFLARSVPKKILVYGVCNEVSIANEENPLCGGWLIFWHFSVTFDLKFSPSIMNVEGEHSKKMNNKNSKMNSLLLRIITRTACVLTLKDNSGRLNFK